MKYGWLSLGTVERAVPFMADRGVSEQARSADGFVTAYRRAGGVASKLGNHKSGQAWKDRREGFLARHTAQMDGDGWEVDGKGSGKREKRPTRRHLALVAWAYSPTPDRLRRWLKQQERQQERKPMVNPSIPEPVPNPSIPVIFAETLAGRLPEEWHAFFEDHWPEVMAGTSTEEWAKVLGFVRKVKPFTFARLPGGTWGIRGEGPAKVGQKVSVRKKDGSTKEVIIDRVIKEDQGAVLASFRDPSPRPSRRASSSRRASPSPSRRSGGGRRVTFRYHSGRTVRLSEEDAELAEDMGEGYVV